MTASKPQPPEIKELDQADVDALLQRLEQASLSPEDQDSIRYVILSYKYLSDLIGDLKTTMRRLRQMLFGASTEKTAAVLERNEAPPEQQTTSAEPASTERVPADAGPSGGISAAVGVDAGELAVPGDATEPSPATKPKRKGHGRLGVVDHPGAHRILVPHPSLQPGDPCPECMRGTVYVSNPPAVFIRFTGQPPVQASVYELERMRCNLCGEVFTASLPTGVEAEKYDATTAAMIGLLKYGSGLPFNRQERLQKNLGVLLPASTQWEIVEHASELFQPVYNELLRMAAQGEVLHNDDTIVRILEYMGERAKQAALDGAAREESTTADENGRDPNRTGLFTTGVVSIFGGHRIALFFSGQKHAGENLKDVLSRRAKELGPPIQMCDALSRNLPKDLQTIVANCLAHARRKFVDVYDRFPAPCQFVLKSLETVYRNDALARQRELTPEQRLEFHQAESGPVMQTLHDWLKRQFEDRLVEPNSALGESFQYLLNHWDKLTLFLRVAGAPLDNNVCERALKKAILHRKNSLFYKTQHGADVGDVYMTLIYTCELCGANPFEYLTELQRHFAQVKAEPSRWLPWNYRATLAADASAEHSAGPVVPGLPR